jgi:hypothetical protein
MDLPEVKVYRMTHIDNIPHVLQNGITHRTSPNHNPRYTAIGDITLINTRGAKQVAVSSTPPVNIIYIVCSIDGIIKNDEHYYFSDGHATDNLTTFYDKTKIGDLPKIIDWNAIKASYWGGQENLNVKRKKQAEFLAAEDVSPNLIFAFGCYNITAKNRLVAFGIPEDKIKVIPNAYY